MRPTVDGHAGTRVSTAVTDIYGGMGHADDAVTTDCNSRQGETVRGMGTATIRT